MDGGTASFSVFRLMHRAMLIGQVLFLAVLYFVISEKLIPKPLEALDRIIQVIAFLVSATALYMGHRIFNKKLVELRESREYASVRAKFEGYRTVTIILWAFIEGASLFCGVCFFLVGNYVFLVMGILLVLLFIWYNPSKRRMSSQTGLTVKEIEDL